MDIQELNKSQLILLAVLLSFVTSIATGITTVTLMQQAPVAFTAPVNRVVQQTVEKIEQVEGKPTVQTVVIKEEDLVVDAIAKNQSAIFSVSKEGQDDSGNTIEVPAGLGFAVSPDGTVVVDGTLVPDKTGVYFLKNDSGKFKADFISADKAGFSFLKIGDPVDGKSKVAFTVPSFGDIKSMKTGQDIIVLGTSVSSLIYEGNGGVGVVPGKSNIGAPVLDLDGNALGIVLSSDQTPFATIQAINNSLNPPKTSASTTPTTASTVTAPVPNTPTTP